MTLSGAWNRMPWSASLSMVVNYGPLQREKFADDLAAMLDASMFTHAVVAEPHGVARGLGLLAEPLGLLAEPLGLDGHLVALALRLARRLAACLCGNQPGS